MTKRVLSVVLALAMMLGMVSVTGLVMAGATATAATVTPVTALPTEANLLVAATTSAAEPAKLIDGVLSTDAGTTWQFSCWGNDNPTVTWNLGDEYTLNKFFIGGTWEATNLCPYAVEVYVGNNEATLYEAANLKLSATDMNSSGKPKDYVLSAEDGSTFDGQYVGFRFTISGSTGAHWGILRLGELGVYGSVAQDVQKIDAVTAVPTETNLLVAATTTATSPSKLIDGILSTDADTTWQFSCWGNDNPTVTWNLGSEKELSKFLIGGTWEATNLCPYAVEVYVGNDEATLYDAANMKFNATNMNSSGKPKDYVLSMSKGTTFKGQYVGFRFTISGSTGAHWGILRLGELGVYGVAEMDELKVEGVSSLPTETNLLTSATTDESNASVLTDGKFDVNNTGRWIKTYWDTLRPTITWDLGAEYELNKFLVGSESGSEQYIREVEIYVGNDKATLYDAANLAISAANLNSAQNHTLGMTVSTFKGQYVGFRFSITKQGPDWEQLRLGELGAYGVAGEPADTLDKKAVTALPTETNVLASATTDESNASVLTDGKFDVNNTGRWIKQYWDTLRPTITWDLGAEYELTKFLVGSESGSEQYIREVEIYVGNDKATLYDAANLAISATDMGSAQNHTLGMTVSTFKGQYVGFRFSITKQGPDWEQLRLGELGAYGTKITVPDVLQVETTTTLPTETNVLTGATATDVSSPAKLTDGVLCTGESSRWMQTYYTTTRPTVTWNLYGVYKLNKFLVGSESGSEQYIREVEIYVGNDEATLYDAANLAISATDMGSAQNHTLAMSVSTFEGQYVGFRFSITKQGPDWEQLRLGELGAYGTKIGEGTGGPKPFEPNALTSFTGFDSETEMNTLVNGQKNLILGEGIKNKPPHLLQNGTTSKLSGEESWLSDGFVHFGTGADKPADNTVSKTPLYYNEDGKQYFGYDLRGTVKFTGILVSGIKAEEAYYRNQSATIYVSDDAATLFDEESCVGMADFGSTYTGVYIDLSALNVSGRHIAIIVPGDPSWKYVRVNELGIYGSYTDGPYDFPDNLIAGKLPVLQTQVDARGIDNKTAVDKDGNPGTGNTGELTGVCAPAESESAANLTDNNTSSRASQRLSYALTSDPLNQKLIYDTPWMVFAYALGGESDVESITVSNSPEPDYYMAGVQYYASYWYKDLFKNESLLYTTGGEYFTEGERGTLIPDESYDVKGQPSITYELTPEQQAQKYRYVAVVVTRPYAVYKPSNPTETLSGYQITRISEINVSGKVTTPEPPFDNVYKVQTSVGEVTMTVVPINYDDRDFFDNTLGGVTVTESKLPATVKPHISDNRLSVDLDTVFTMQLLDKNGNPLADTTDDIATGLNGRDIEFIFPATNKDHIQSMAVLENGTLRRLYNSATNLNSEGREVNAGAQNYPVYMDTMPNNRKLATITKPTVSLVYMKLNSIAEVNEIGGVRVNQTLAEFMEAGGVAGASQQAAPSAMPVALCVTAGMAMVTGAVLLVLRRKAKRVHQ